jgi:hypothetical protein
MGLTQREVVFLVAEWQGGGNSRCTVGPSKREGTGIKEIKFSVNKIGLTGTHCPKRDV